jgi:hypothetical protein
MLSQLARADVVRAYSSKRPVLNPAGFSLPNEIEMLPPFLLYSLHHSLKPPSGMRALFTGSDAAVLELVTKDKMPSLLLCKSGLDPCILRDLDLTQYSQVEPSVNFARMLKQAVESLDSYPHVDQMIRDWTSMLVIINPDQPDSWLSSASFYSFPHCTFLTELAARFLPDQHIVSRPEIYCLQENLYHESLHQFLFRFMQQCPCFKSDMDNVRTAVIHPSWHTNVSWALEHALQVCFVYGHVARMRLLAINKVSQAHRGVLKSAADVACKHTTELTNALMSFSDFFTEIGLFIVADLEGMARRST